MNETLSATRAYVGNLPYRTGDEDLRVHFQQAGEVVDARVITDRDTGRSRGFGFVEFREPAQLQKAIEDFHGKELEGRTLNVHAAHERKPR